jgi:hypothetical protein
MDHFALFMLEIALAVGITVGLAVRLIQLAVGRIRGRPFSRTVGRTASMAWACGFAIAAFAAAAFISIGIFVLPVAMIVCAIAAWRCRALPEGAIGASLGSGVVLCLIGLMNPTRPSCDPSLGMVLRGGQRASYLCGGVDGTSWLPLAVVLVVIAVAGQAMLMMIERRDQRRDDTRGAGGSATELRLEPPGR